MKPTDLFTALLLAGFALGCATPAHAAAHSGVSFAAPKNRAVVLKDATHLHFGKGQTETMLSLVPGRHKLTLQFANGLHQSYGYKWCKSIHVTAK